MANRKLSPDDMMKVGIYELLGSVGFYLFDNYQWATTFLFTGIVIFLIGYWQLNRDDEISGFQSFAIVSTMCLSIYASGEVANYMNKQSSIQKLCGSVENIKIVKGRGVSTFDLVAKDRQQTFAYNEHKAIVSSYPNLCIDYSFDHRWSEYTHIVEIYPQPHQ